MMNDSVQAMYIDGTTLYPWNYKIPSQMIPETSIWAYGPAGNVERMGGIGEVLKSTIFLAESQPQRLTLRYYVENATGTWVTLDMSIKGCSGRPFSFSESKAMKLRKRIGRSLRKTMMNWLGWI